MTEQRSRANDDESVSVKCRRPLESPSTIERQTTEGYEEGRRSLAMDSRRNHYCTSAFIDDSNTAVIAIVTTRGVQYVHWVMHKCIMFKVGRKRKTQKARKKEVNFSKTGGAFLKVGRK